jgi:hypothetical protein
MFEITNLLRANPGRVPCAINCRDDANLSQQQVNAPKPSVKVLQLGASVGGGVIGLRARGGDGVFGCEIDDADQDYDPERNG